MSYKRSTALRKAIATQMPYSVARGNARLKEYQGTPPTSPDKAPTGTLLGTYTLNGGTPTDEVRATAVLVFGGASGSVDSITVGGGIPLIDSAVAFGASLAATVDAVAAAINAKQQIPFFDAVSDGISKVTIKAPVGAGADFNGVTIACGTTTMTVAINGGDGATFGQAVTSGAQTVGVSAVNLCNMQYPDAAGVLTKESTIWQMTAIATGTAGYVRIEYDPDDDQSESTLYRREDITLSVSGGTNVLQVGSTGRTSGVSYSIDSGTFTVPES